MWMIIISGIQVLNEQKAESSVVFILPHVDAMNT